MVNAWKCAGAGYLTWRPAMLHRTDVLNHPATGEPAGKPSAYCQLLSRRRDGVRWTAFALVSLLLSHGSPASAGGFTVTNLVTNTQGGNAAKITDPSPL